MLPHTGLTKIQFIYVHNLLKTNFEVNMSFIKELWIFLRARKKFWMFPIILVMALLGGLLILAQGSVVAPFIYTLF